MSDNHTVILLRGKENYNDWLININSILQMCELYHYVVGSDTKRPEDLDGGTAEQVAKQKAEQTLWDRKANNACGTITQSLYPNIQNTIQGFNSPANMMAWLKKLFDIGQTVGRNQLFTKIFTLKMAKGTDLTAYFARIDDLLRAVQTNEMKFTDDLINWIMINSLPAQYNTTKAIIVTSLSNITKEEVRQQIYNSHQSQDQLDNATKETLLYANAPAPAWTTPRQPQACRGKNNPHRNSEPQLQGQAQQGMPQRNHQDCRETAKKPMPVCSYCTCLGHSANQCLNCLCDIDRANLTTEGNHAPVLDHL